MKALNRENNWMATFELLSVSATLGGANHQYIIKKVGITNQKEMPTKLSTSVPNNLGANKSGRANTNRSNNKMYIAQKMKHATMARVVNKSSNKVLPKTGGGESNTSHQYVWLMLLSGALLMLIGYRCKTKCRRNKE